MIVKCYSELDTDRLASIVADLAFKGCLILANGDLGAGKTRFAKGLAKFLGVKGNVTSPTFNILKCYEGEKYDFYHIDAYRLEGVKQDIGLDEFIEGDGVCFIEWSEFVSYLLPEEYLKMNITIDNDIRVIELIGAGKRYEELVKEIERLW